MDNYGYPHEEPPDQTVGQPMPIEKTDVEKYAPRWKPTGPYVQLIGDMVGMSVYDIPAGRILTGVYSADADATQLQVDILIAAGREPITFMDGNVWVGAANEVTMVNHLVSDGTSLRIANAGANQCDAVYYTYEV